MNTRRDDANRQAAGDGVAGAVLGAVQPAHAVTLTDSEAAALGAAAGTARSGGSQAPARGAADRRQ